MASTLVELVLGGHKTASAGLHRSFSADDQPPVVGRYSIVLDGRDVPRCIIQTRQVEVKPLSEADETFAWDEGEGDRTLDWWMQAHLAYFERAAQLRWLRHAPAHRDRLRTLRASLAAT